MQRGEAMGAPLPIRDKRYGDALFFYDAIYEGHACDPMMFVIGEVPETQIAPIVPYLQDTTTYRQRSCAAWPATRPTAGWRAGCSPWPTCSTA
jgi:hypothetical protein